MSKKGRMTKGKPKWRFRGVHTLRFKRNRTLIVMVFDDRVFYFYAKTVPQYKETDGTVCRLWNEPVMIYDYRIEGDHDCSILNEDLSKACREYDGIRGKADE